MDLSGELGGQVDGPGFFFSNSGISFEHYFCLTVGHSVTKSNWFDLAWAISKRLMLISFKFFKIDRKNLIVGADSRLNKGGDDDENDI